MSKIIKLGVEARKELVEGMNCLSKAVIATLGPNGRNAVYINEEGSAVSTKDGVSVAKLISFKDPIKNLGAKMIKQTAIKTAEKAGDGTTTATLLAQEMINEGLKYLNLGSNVVEIKRGIDLASKEIIRTIQDQISEEISSEDQLEQVATISANNDSEVGKLIAESMKKVGRDGIVTIEESKTGETYLEVVEGVQFDRGYKSHYFVTNNNEMACILNDPYILIADEKFTTIKDLLPLLEAVSSEGKSLLIIAEDIENEALATLIVNKGRGILKICAVKAPDYGERRKLILEDIAIMTGGLVYSKVKGMKLDKFNPDMLGNARLINITKDQTTIIDGKGSPELIQTRIEELQNQIEKSKTPFEIEKLQERLANFTGGAAIVHVGGNTEAEMKEKKDRVDDALNATKAALEEGIVAGGGSALLFGREGITITKEEELNDTHLGKQIVYKACGKPFQQILKNAGYSDEEIYPMLNRIAELGEIGTRPWYGFDLKLEQVVDMKEAGIIDPTKVVRLALENAASVAGTVLLTEVVIVDEPEDKKEEYNPMAGMF